MTTFRSHSFFGGNHLVEISDPPLFKSTTTERVLLDKSERLIKINQLEDWYNILNDFLTDGERGVGDQELEALRDELYSYLRG